jgi:glycyl-tRNA synthetase
LSSKDKFEILSEIAKRRGFFWPSYEIYGGESGFITFGPLGAALKRRIEDKFRDFFIRPLNLLEIESSVITPGKVFEASGHIEAFKEPIVECKQCHRKFRADQLLQEIAEINNVEKLSLKELEGTINEQKISCPECGGEFGAPKQFTTMFNMNIGPYSEKIGYGRPEAAQGIFVEFRRLREYARGRLPFGAVQIGHAVRNEISPRQGPIRLREFTIADVEFFFDPKNPGCPQLKKVENEKLRLIPAEIRLKDSKEPIKATVKEALQKRYIKEEWQAFFMVLSQKFLRELGVPENMQRFIEKMEWERAHYSTQGYDQEIYLERWGWVEVSGHNCRTDYDLKQHMKFSGIDMQVFEEYEKPIVKKEIMVNPVMKTIGPAFKDDASKVKELLLDTDPDEIVASLEKQGYYTTNSFKIQPEHVEILTKKVEKRGRRFVPHVVEPSFGLDRLAYVTLEYAYKTKEERVLMSFPRELAPVQLSVFPLMSKDALPGKAKQVHQMLTREGFTVEYDEVGSIGRRYARADEAGTPLDITVDYQTLEDDTVTIRDRDSWKQVRNKIEKLPKLLHSYFQYKLGFDQLGRSVELR